MLTERRRQKLLAVHAAAEQGRSSRSSSVAGPTRGIKSKPPLSVQLAWEPEDEEVEGINEPPFSRSSLKSRADPYASDEFARAKPQASPILAQIGNLSLAATEKSKPRGRLDGPSPIVDPPSKQHNISITMGQDQKLTIMRMCRLLDVFSVLDTRDAGVIKAHDISVGLARHFGVDLSGHDSDSIISFLNGNSGEVVSRVDFVRGFQYYELLGALNYSMKLDHCEFEAGHFIIAEGETAKHLYILQSGEAVVETHGQIVHRYDSKGDTFGDLGKIYRGKSGTCIYATSKTRALRVHVSVDQKSVPCTQKNLSSPSEHILHVSQYHRSRGYTNLHSGGMSPSAWEDRNSRQGRITARKQLDRESFIYMVPLFESMPAELLSKLATYLKRKTYPTRRDITKQGEFTDTMYIIADGIVEMCSASSTVQLVGKDSFGELGLVFRERSMVTVVTKVPTTVFYLSSRDFDECLNDYADYRVVISLLAEERRLHDMRNRGVPEVLYSVAPFLCDKRAILGEQESNEVPAWQLRILIQDVLMNWSGREIDWLLTGGPNQIELTHQLHFDDPKQVLDYNQVLFGSKVDPTRDNPTQLSLAHELSRWHEWKREWSEMDSRYYFSTSTPRGSSRCSQWEPPSHSPWDSVPEARTEKRAAGVTLGREPVVSPKTLAEPRSTTPWDIRPGPNLPKWLADLQARITRGSTNVFVLFRNFDADNSGTVDVEELDHGLKKIGISLSDEDFKSLVGYVDPDGMGVIEIHTLVERLTHSETVVQEDASGSQVLTVAKENGGADWVNDAFIKMRKWMQRVGLSPATTFKRYSSGGRGMMTADNFADTIRKGNSSLSGMQTDKLMHIVDLNDDGRISLDEWMYRFDESSKPPEWAESAWTTVLASMAKMNISPRELLQNLETSKDGKIPIVALARGISSVEPSFNHEDALACARRFDTDSSGMVNSAMLANGLSGQKVRTEDNILTNVRNKLLKNNTPESIGEAFARWDFDGSGTLSADEFKRGLQSMGIGLNLMQVKKLIDHIDADGDGEISFDEFVTRFLKKQVVPVKQVEQFRKHLQICVFDQQLSWRQLFDLWDVNRSGFLSVDAFRDGLQQLPRLTAKFPMINTLVDGLFSIADINDDGLLKFGEFVDFMADKNGRQSIVAHEDPLASFSAASASPGSASDSVQAFTERIFKQKVSPIEAFRCFDIDNDGFISRGEFVSGFSGHSSAVTQTLGDLRTLELTPRQVDEIYDKMEGSHRDFIAFDAFQKLTNEEKLSPHHESALVNEVQQYMQSHAHNAEGIFRIWNYRHDGMLDLVQFKKGLNSIGNKSSDSVRAQFFASMDGDRDGVVNASDFEDKFGFSVVTWDWQENALQTLATLLMTDQSDPLKAFDDFADRAHRLSLNPVNWRNFGRLFADIDEVLKLGLRPFQWKLLFHVVDKDEDGFFGKDDFLETFGSFHSNGRVTPMGKASQVRLSSADVFRRADKNGDGFLDLEDFKTALLLTRPQSTPAEIKVFWEHVDVGKQGRVDIETFCKRMASTPSQLNWEESVVENLIHIVSAKREALMRAFNGCVREYNSSFCDCV
jgi:calmodulin